MTSYQTTDRLPTNATDNLWPYVSKRVKDALADINPFWVENRSYINGLTDWIIQQAKERCCFVDDVFKEWETALRTSTSQRTGIVNYNQSSIYTPFLPSIPQPYVENTAACGILANIDHAVSEHLKHVPEITRRESEDGSLLFEITAFVAPDYIKYNDTESLPATFVFNYLCDLMNMRAEQKITIVDYDRKLSYVLMRDPTAVSSIEFIATETNKTLRQLLWGLSAFLPGYDITNYSKSIPEWPSRICIRQSDGVLKASCTFMVEIVKSDNPNLGEFFDKLKNFIDACQK